MKKLIAVLMITAMLFGSIIALVPASAADLAYEYKVDYTNLDFKAYAGKRQPMNNTSGAVSNPSAQTEYEGFLDDIQPTVEENLLALKVINSSSNGFYVANEGIKITADTNYTYYVQAKNNRVGGYTGVPYAMCDGVVYALYGALANGGDDDKSKCCLRACAGMFDSELFGSRWEAKVAQDLTEDGFGQYKLVFTGYDLNIFTLSGGKWVQLSFAKEGNSRSTITLPEGAEIVVGAYSRDADSGNSQRTPTITNTVIVADNEAAAKYLAPISFGHVYKKANLIDPDNYTSDTYAALDAALLDAMGISDESAPAQIQACTNALSAALAGLKSAFSVKFDANGAAGTMAALENVMGEIELPAEATFTAPAGKHLAGWSLTADGELLEGNKLNVTSSVTVYAIWETTTYGVSFNSNGAAGKMFAVDGVLGAYTLPQCKYTAPEGKVFKGWATSADGAVITGETIDVSADVTLYAIWGDPTFAVTFDANGGTGEMTAADVSGEYTLPENAFTAPEGKQFKGWALTKDGEVVTAITVTKPVTVYVIWEDAPEKPVETQMPTEASATEAPAEGGCGGSVVATVAVVAVVSTLGVAVLRKKED